MHLPGSKDGTSLGRPGHEPVDSTASRKVAAGDHGGPASPSSPPKTTREKPQKVLPCPRCESMNTKFCYYNNYSVNQPRHFCRQCQRYWTVGGTLRNVPVGGGSRKKHRHPGQPQQHHRAGEPYLRTGPLALATPGQLAPPLASFPHGGPLPHELTGFHFSQLPGLVPQNHHSITGAASYAIDQSSAPGLFPISFSTKPGNDHEFQPPPMYGAMGGSSFYPDLGALQLEPHQTTTSGAGHVKPKLWPSNHQQGAGPATSWSAPHTSWELQSKPATSTDHVSTSKTTKPSTHHGGGYADSTSMMLHLGLNTRPHHGKPDGAPWSSTNQDHTSSRAGGHPVNGASPPHGSSTIEEEGSTPANGYSNNGYEETDTVSSMWQEMQNMQDIFQ